MARHSAAIISDHKSFSCYHRLFFLGFTLDGVQSPMLSAKTFSMLRRRYRPDVAQRIPLGTISRFSA